MSAVSLTSKNGLGHISADVSSSLVNLKNKGRFAEGVMVVCGHKMGGRLLGRFNPNDAVNFGDSHGFQVDKENPDYFILSGICEDQGGYDFSRETSTNNPFPAIRLYMNSWGELGTKPKGPIIASLSTTLGLSMRSLREKTVENVKKFNSMPPRFLQVNIRYADARSRVYYLTLRALDSQESVSRTVAVLGEAGADFYKFLAHTRQTVKKPVALSPQRRLGLLLEEKGFCDQSWPRELRNRLKSIHLDAIFSCILPRHWQVQVAT